MAPALGRSREAQHEAQGQGGGGDRRGQRHGARARAAAPAAWRARRGRGPERERAARDRRAGGRRGAPRHLCGQHRRAQRRRGPARAGGGALWQRGRRHQLRRHHPALCSPQRPGVGGHGARHGGQLLGDAPHGARLPAAPPRAAGGAPGQHLEHGWLLAGARAEPLWRQQGSGEAAHRGAALRACGHAGEGDGGVPGGPSPPTSQPTPGCP